MSPVALNPHDLPVLELEHVTSGSDWLKLMLDLAAANLSVLNMRPLREMYFRRRLGGSGEVTVEP
jgi:hypothetical protein